jgi:hypothetical protein
MTEMFGEELTSPMAYGDRVALRVRKETLVILEIGVQPEAQVQQDLPEPQVQREPLEPLEPLVQREPLEPLVLPDLLKNLSHLSTEPRERLRV